MSNRGLFIVVEGVDGVGKSTIVKKVANSLGARAIATPGGIWRKYRSLVENAHPTIRFLYYVISNHFSSFVIRRMLKESHVICDRFSHSTKAHHVAYGSRIARYYPLALMANCQPDLVYYLSVSSEEREIRIKNRPGNAQKDLDSSALKRVHRIFRLLPGMTEIDTTHLDEDKVTSLIYRDIKNKKAVM